MTRVSPGTATSVTVSAVGVQDGSDTNIKASVFDYTSSNPLAVRLTDTSGDYVSAGAGTQYTEGDTDTTITGTALMWEDASDTLRAVSSAKPLPVNNAHLTSLGGAISGTEVQVDIVGSLPAGTNAIGKLAANSGVDIGDVDVTSIAAGDNNIGNVDVVTVPTDPFGANADAASATGSISAKLRFIAATGIPITGTVTVGSHAVTNAGTFAVQESGSALTALQLIDDIVNTDDTSTHATGTSKGALFMAAATPTDGSVNANDIGAVAMTTDRKLHVSVQDALPAGTNAIGKLAANSGVDIGDVDITSIAAGDNNIGNVDIASIAAGDNNIGNVDIVSGTITTVSTVTALGAGTTGPMKAEDVAHSTGDQGFPDWGVRVDTPNATVAANGDYHYKATDMVGGVRTALYETDFAVLGTNHVKKYYTNAGAVTDGIVWSPAAGKRWYVTDIFINVSAAATVTLEDDLAAGDSAVWKAELAANSGWSHPFGTPLFSGEDAADLIITTSAANVYVTVTGYEI